MAELRYIIIFSTLTSLLVIGCKKELPERPVPPCKPATSNVEQEDSLGSGTTLHGIDLSNWKVTLPISSSGGDPIEVSPPEILNYSDIELLEEFMYNDPSDSSLVFYTYPGASTANSSYSRTELREQLEPGSNSVNWTFADGGKMRGTLSVPEVSVEDDGDPHRIIIMQIHGRLTDAQRNLIGQSDNNAPPVLKIYWRDGKVYVRTKQLIDLDSSYEEALFTDAWEDDDGIYFAREVNDEVFTLEVEVSEGLMTVTLDDEETLVYDDIHMERWGIFENYFKAGNYLVTTDEGAFSRVKYYELEVTHE